MIENVIADTLQTTIPLTGAIPDGTIFLLPNDWIIDLLCFILGFAGIFIRILSRLVKMGGKESFAILRIYFHDHPLTISLSVLCYLVIIAIWYFQGVDFFGWYAYRLNFSTIFLGYASQDIFNTMFKKKFGDIGDDTPNKQNGDVSAIATVVESPNTQVSQSALQQIHD